MLKKYKTKSTNVHFIYLNSSKNTKSSDLFRVDTSFHFAIWPVLALAQCFCILPINGIQCNDLEYEKASDRLRFRWGSFRVIWTMVCIGFGTVLTYLYFHRLSNTGVTAKNIGLLLRKRVE